MKENLRQNLNKLAHQLNEFSAASLSPSPLLRVQGYVNTELLAKRKLGIRASREPLGV